MVREGGNNDNTMTGASTLRIKEELKTNVISACVGVHSQIDKTCPFYESFIDWYIVWYQ